MRSTMETIGILKVSVVFLPKQDKKDKVVEAVDKIMGSAEELFMQYGIRSVTMDDVARAAAMSKKTLYLHFENKEHLVLEVAKNHFRKEQVEFAQIEKDATDALDEILRVSQCLRQHLFKMNPSLLFDMQKYHGAAWDSYLQFKNEVIKGQIERNIERGKAEGYFRKEIDAKVLSIFRVEGVLLVFNPKLFPREEFDFASVQLQVLDHFIYGLLTDQGRIKYKEYTIAETSNYS